MKFEDSSIIITGGSKGVGFSIAEIFAKNTAHPIVLVARNMDNLLSAKEKLLNLGAKSVECISVDLIDEEEVAAIDFGRFNPGIIVNNAGYFLFKPLEKTTYTEFKNQLEINTLSAFNITQAVLPYLQKQDKALIVNICSEDALEGKAYSGAYVSSKHALLGYTRSLRKELLATHIAVTAINLGQTFSHSWDGVDIDVNRLIDPLDVGRLILGFSQLSARTVVEEILVKPQGGEVPPM